jgi:hypothetical protein
MTDRLSFRAMMLLALLACGFAAPSRALAACVGGSTLSGSYGMLAHGQTPSGQLKFLNGWIYFNGACLLTGSLTIGEGGTVNSFATVNGSYNTNADNTITISLTIPGEAAPETYDVGYSPVFGEALGLETDSSAVGSIDFKQQIYPQTGPHNVYNDASLKGTFAASCEGATGGDSDLNYVSFDGNTNGYGNVTGYDHSDDYGTFFTAPYAGQYGVNSTGTFGGYVVVTGGATVGFSGIIDNNLNEIQYVYSFAGPTGSDFEYCTAKRVK